MNKIWPLPSKNLQTTNKHIWNYNVSLQFQVSLTEITIMSFRRSEDDLLVTGVTRKDFLQAMALHLVLKNLERERAFRLELA